MRPSLPGCICSQRSRPFANERQQMGESSGFAPRLLVSEVTFLMTDLHCLRVASRGIMIIVTASADRPPLRGGQVRAKGLVSLPPDAHGPSVSRGNCRYSCVTRGDTGRGETHLSKDNGKARADVWAHGHTEAGGRARVQARMVWLEHRAFADDGPKADSPGEIPGILLTFLKLMSWDENTVLGHKMCLIMAVRGPKV